MTERAEIDRFLVNLLIDMTDEWDLDLEEPIGQNTELVADLGFSSIDFIHLITDVEEHFGRPKLPFDQLFMADGQYIRALSVAKLGDFIHSHLGGES